MDMNKLRVEALRRVMGGLTQAEFAERHDLNASYISQILSGHRSFGERAASNMEKKIGLTAGTLSRPPLGDAEGPADKNNKESNVIAADFSPRRAREGEIDIPHYDVRAAMGAGQVLPSDYIETIRHVTVSIEYLRTQGVSYTQPDNLGMITGFGESMNKTFTSGDPLIIDKGVTSVVTDGVYLFTLSGALFVKRLQIIPGGYRVISDNDAYPPYDITGADLKHLTIHARVLLAWRSQKL